MNIRELALLIGLSKSAVSLALRNDPSIPAATQKRVQRAAEKYGYRLNPKLSELMSSLARKESGNMTAPLALLSNWPQPKMWTTGNTFLRRIHEGATQRAKDIGYRLEEFWLGERGMSPTRMQGILKTRGIEGVLIYSYPIAPAVLEMDLSGFATVVIGRALVQPRVYAVDIDHFHGFFVAWETIISRGYRRPGLVLSGDLDERTEHSWSAAFRFAVSGLPAKQRLPILSLENFTPTRLRGWLRRHQPDVLLVADPRIFSLIDQAQLKIPDEVALAVLFQNDSTGSCAGINGGDEYIGARAVDLLTEQLRTHRQGLPTTPETVLLDGFWCDGPSLPQRVVSPARKWPSQASSHPVKHWPPARA